MENDNRLMQVKRKDVVRALPSKRFTDYDDMPKLLAYCEAIANSEFSPFARAEDVAAALLWANAKNISAIDALSHLVIVNGKVVPDSYLTGALLLREASVTFEIKQVRTPKGVVREDCRPLYVYKSQTSVYTDEDLDSDPELYQVVTVQQVKEQKGLKSEKIHVIREAMPYDFRTIILFKRLLRLPDNTFQWITEEGEWTYQEAVRAKLADKAVWVNYLKDMLYNRAFTRGARRIGKDLLLKDNAQEVLDLNDVPYEIEDGEFTVLD
jgi:hypothetical protein